MSWKASVDSDEDGLVDQPSFVLTSSLQTDDTGTVIGTDSLLIEKKSDSAVNKAQDEWRTMFGGECENRQAIRDFELESKDLSVDPEMLEGVLKRFYTSCGPCGTGLPTTPTQAEFT